MPAASAVWLAATCCCAVRTASRAARHAVRSSGASSDPSVAVVSVVSAAASSSLAQICVALASAWSAARRSASTWRSRVEHGLLRGRELGVGTAPARGRGRNERDRLHDPVVAGTAHRTPRRAPSQARARPDRAQLAFGERRLEGVGVERRQRVADGDRVTDRDVHLARPCPRRGTRPTPATRARRSRRRRGPRRRPASPPSRCDSSRRDRNRRRPPPRRPRARRATTTPSAMRRPRRRLGAGAAKAANESRESVSSEGCTGHSLRRASMGARRAAREAG